MTQKRISEIRYATKPGGWWMQAVSYDNRMHEEDPTQCMVNLVNVLQTPLEREILEEAQNDPDRGTEGWEHPRLATMQDTAWKALDESWQERFLDLYLFGEHTRLVQRLFKEDPDGTVMPVVMRGKGDRDECLAMDMGSGIMQRTEEA